MAKEQKNNNATASAESLEQRASQFRREVLSFMGKYPVEFLAAFVNYWAEDDGRLMLWEKERRRRSWRTASRLVRFSFNGKLPVPPEDIIPELRESMFQDPSPGSLAPVQHVAVLQQPPSSINPHPSTLLPLPSPILSQLQQRMTETNFRNYILAGAVRWIQSPTQLYHTTVWLAFPSRAVIETMMETTDNLSRKTLWDLIITAVRSTYTGCTIRFYNLDTNTEIKAKYE